MSNNNTPSNHPPNPTNTNNHHHPQMGVAGNYQNQNFMQPFIPPPPFINNPNMAPQNNGNCNPMFHAQGQGQGFMNNVVSQMNLSQIQGQILAQNLLNFLQQPNMNMNVPNGQFGQPVGSYPMQNMNQQQLPMQMMQMQRPMNQGVSYGMNNNNNNGPNPMFRFPNAANQVPPRAMVPQNPMFNANSQFGMRPGNQVRPQIGPIEKNRVPTNGNANGFVSGGPFPSQQLQGNSSVSGGPFPPQRLQGNSSVPLNANNAQSLAFRSPQSQENPNSNIKTNATNSNWKGSPNPNFKNKPNRGGSQGGFHQSKFRDNNKGNKRFPKEHNKSKGPINERGGNSGINSEETQQEPKRSFIVNYSEQEIQQWREARKKNHPFREKKEKIEPSKDSKVIDREVLQRELKEVLAKQAELGIEVAEIPSHYLKNGANQGRQDNRRSRNNMVRGNQDRRSHNRNNKRQKLADKDFLENKKKQKKQTLLQKLLSADTKRDKSHLLQVFRFMTANLFFKDYPDKPLVYPSVLVKEIESGTILGHGTKEIDQNFVKDSNIGNDNEDEENDEFDEEEEGEILE